jgi:steroid delta-isomerase
LSRPLAETFARYVAYVSAGDVDGIVSLYAPSATLQIPVGGPIHEGIDAIHAFYHESKLAQKLELAGNPCVAGREGAVAMKARVVRDGITLELDVVDVASVDDEGRLTSLRAFFDLEGARPVSD